MDDENKIDDPKVRADNNSIAVGGINIGGDVSGNITIGNAGFTSDEVSVLITQIQSTFQPKPFDGRCPYKGLDVFEEEDAELFFGREKLVADLVSRVKNSRKVFVTGPSGSGKSSLVRAGLIHALKQGAVKGSDRWLYATMKPGRDPIGELGRVASSLAGSTNAEDEIRAKTVGDGTIFARWCEIALKEGRDKRVVLFIDQFEEAFTQISNEEERVAFLNLLTHAATVENGRVIILFSMRSDFVSNCATYPQLNALLNQQFVQIGAMQPEELVSAIAQPALRVGLRIDPDLIAQIINDMKGEPGALPLMQFSLKDLFDGGQTKGGVIALTLNDYLQRGGIQKSLERHADAAFAKLQDHEQELARSIFSGLIEIGRGIQDTRRTALFKELIPANAKAEEVEAIVQKLADARLITTDEQAGNDTVTISHEKLIDAWPWLKKLVNENRDVITLQNEISADAKEWEDHKRDASYLYTGGRLANVREQLNAKKLVLSGPAQDFVQVASTRQRRTQLSLIAGVSTIIVFLVISVLVFSRQSSENAELAKQAHLRELASQSALLRDQRLQTSLLLGVEVFRQLDNPQTRGVLLDNVQSHPQLLQYLNGHSDSVTSVTFSPDGIVLASGCADNTITLWDFATNTPLGQPLTGHTDSVNSIAFSPDGKILASGSSDNTIILWDVITHQMIGQPFKGHSASVNSIAFSPDGQTLASGGGDNTVMLWNVSTHKLIGHPLKEADTVYSIAFSPDGDILASGSADKTIILWDVATQQPIGQPLTGHLGSIFSVHFSPDGKTLASGSNDNNIILWDVVTHQPISQPLTGHSSRINSIAFSPDGTTFASGSFDSTIILWNAATHEPIGDPLTGHTGSVNSVSFDPDGNVLASGSSDNTVALWDVEKYLTIGHRLAPHSGSQNSIAYSTDGSVLASGNYSGTIILWDTNTRQPIGQPLAGHSGSVNSVAFNSNSSILASGSMDNTIILWDINTHQPIGQPLAGHLGSVNSVAFSPDGTTFASGGEDGTIILWDIDTHQPISEPLTEHSGSVNSVAFSPDGKTLASGNEDGTIILWNIDTHQPIGKPLAGHSSSVRSIAFNPDSATLASGSEDGTIILWNIETHQPIGQPLKGHSGSIYSISFSADGQTLASGGFDSTVILWDVASRLPIGQPLSGHTGSVYSIAFSPKEMVLASGSLDNTIILWDLSPQSWITKTCQRVGRNFTPTEWSQYFGDQINPYKNLTCPLWKSE